MIDLRRPSWGTSAMAVSQEKYPQEAFWNKRDQYSSNWMVSFSCHTSNCSFPPRIPMTWQGHVIGILGGNEQFFGLGVNMRDTVMFVNSELLLVKLKCICIFRLFLNTEMADIFEILRHWRRGAIYLVHSQYHDWWCLSDARNISESSTISLPWDLMRSHQPIWKMSILHKHIWNF